MCAYKVDEETVLHLLFLSTGLKISCQRNNTEGLLKFCLFPNNWVMCRKIIYPSHLLCPRHLENYQTQTRDMDEKLLSCHWEMSYNSTFTFNPVSLWIIKSDSSSKEMVSITHSVAILTPTCCLEVKDKWGEFKQKLCWDFREALGNFVSKFSMFTS